MEWWSTMLATLAGGTLGLSSSMLIDRTRSRRDRREQWLRIRLEVYVDYLAELSKAYEALWALARGEYEGAGTNVDAAARLILRGAAIFQTRQRLLILASPSVRSAGDVAFNHLMQLRSVVGTGSLADSPEFRSANQAYRASMDALREAMRAELDLPDDPEITSTSTATKTSAQSGRY
jgi:hypothetical protein